MTRRMVIALLALVGVFLALYLTLYKLGYIGHLACGTGSCERVQSSRWSVLLGMPVAAWGAAFYVTLFVVAFIGTLPKWSDSRTVSRILLGLTAWGLLFTGYLTWLELFVIHGICMYCVSSAVLVVSLFAVSALDLGLLTSGGDSTGQESSPARADA
jgi:uncharacterized membrane protein